MEPSNVENVSNVEELNEEETVDIVEQKPNEFESGLRDIYNNVNAGQQIKGVFTMQECMLIIKSKTNLLEFFKNGNNSFTTDKINDDYLIILKAVEKLQATGVFHMEGSMNLFNILTLLEKEIDNRKSPSDAMKELREKKVFQQQKLQNGGGNRGRGNGNRRGGKNGGT